MLGLLIAITSTSDIHEIAHDVLAHRILLTYQAEAESVRIHDVINELLRLIPIP